MRIVLAWVSECLISFVNWNESRRSLFDYVQVEYFLYDPNDRRLPFDKHNSMSNLCTSKNITSISYSIQKNENNIQKLG
mgnify:CR=1 FL=1